MTAVAVVAYLVTIESEETQVPHGEVAIKDLITGALAFDEEDKVDIDVFAISAKDALVLSLSVVADEAAFGWRYTEEDRRIRKRLLDMFVNVCSTGPDSR